MSRHVLKAGLPVGAALLALAQGPAAADGVDVFVTATAVPTFHVKSDGTRYTGLVTEPAEKFRFEADLIIEGGRDRIHRWAVAPNLRLDGKRWGWSFDTSRPPEDEWGVVSKSYGSGDRPTSVHRHIVMAVDPSFVDDFLVAACNGAADRLRAQGAGDAAIFADDQVLEPSVKFPNSVTYRNIADLHNDPVEDSGAPALQPKIVCMKHEGPHRSVKENLETPVTVAAASLLTLEKYGPGGMCKIVLSGVIETNLPNAEVKFRYEHSGGQKSNVKTVKTDFTKTVMFSDEYDVPNKPGDEIGKVRLVGENIDFQSGWSAYRMECTAPGDLQAKTLPKLELTVAAGKTVMVNGQICPSNLLLQGLVKAGSAFDGKALFLGNAFLTAPQPVSVEANKVQHLFANRSLDWGSGSNAADTLSSGGSPAALKSQKVRLGFNLVDAQGKLVGQTPQKEYTVTCKKPGRNPDVSQGGAGMLSAPSE
jgi:hypothetical protein